MEKKERLIEVRTADGKPILSLRLTDREIGSEDRQDVPSAQNSQAKAAGGQFNMTNAQKRYLFRILADQGMEPEEAHEHLKKEFGVTSLQEVSKTEASRMIESLLEKAESK